MPVATQASSTESNPATQIHVGETEASFYSRYEWCLNPLITFADQLHRLAEELDALERVAAGPEWQRAECTINVYLFACALACTMDDYLGRSGWDAGALAERFPRLAGVFRLLRRGFDLPRAIRDRTIDRTVRRWRERWTSSVDLACELLVGVQPRQATSIPSLRTGVAAIARARLPRALRSRRLRIPEGFRCQDLSHHDVLTLARRFAAREGSRGAVSVVGIRTAGAYFAPLVKACLAALGWTSVSWLTIRPRGGLTLRERRVLKDLARGNGGVVVVDDHPNTGRTLARVLAAIQKAGVAPERITVLTPRHPVQPDWTLPPYATGGDRVEVITLEPDETFKARLLTSDAMAPLLREWLEAQGGDRIVVRTSPALDAANARLSAHFGDNFQVRLKRVFEIEVGDELGARRLLHVVGKSVGWGWLGYHAYVAGRRLKELVPPMIGLRHGVLFSEWLGPLEPEAGSRSEIVPLATAAKYVARRARDLPLNGDPRLVDPDHVWSGWEMLTAIVRRVYGSYAGRVKLPLLRRELRRFAAPHPTLIDGRMRADEWLAVQPGDVYKTDYEHHNFGPAELDIVDPAYDLAAAVLELGLDPAAETQLIATYRGEIEDPSIADRVWLYKLLSGTIALEQGAYWAPRAGSPRQRLYWHERYLRARNFLVYQVHGSCAALLPERPRPNWSDPLVFLDLDGVFDCEVLGFPHSTASGLRALALLQTHGFAVVINTGRSVEHVLRYCRMYGLPGGVAEYGSVFVDSVGGREVALTSATAARRLQACREALGAMPGVFVDHHYRYAARAYRYVEGRMAGLGPEEVRRLVSRPEFSGLDCIETTADTYFVEAGVTKGSAVVAVKQDLGRSAAPVVAIGDSDQDLSMLALAQSWYAPANCSPRVRALAGAGVGHVMSKPAQRGFLEAVRHLLRDRGITPAEIPGLQQPACVRSAADLMLTLFHIAERPRISQLVRALAWRRF